MGWDNPKAVPTLLPAGARFRGWISGPLSWHPRLSLAQTWSCLSIPKNALLSNISESSLQIDLIESEKKRDRQIMLDKPYCMKYTGK